MKISIPKDFYENKPSVTHLELLGMITEMVNGIQELEEKLNYELETEFKAMHENIELKKRIKQLEEQLKNKGE